MEKINSQYESRNNGVMADIENLENIRNQNVRRVALLARETKERQERDLTYKIKGTYSEAYQGESA